MDTLSYLFDWKSFLLIAAVFIPLERLFSMHPEQKLFRRAWTLDLIYVALNGLLIKVGSMMLIYVGVVAGSHLVPDTIRSAIASQPYWLQVIEVLVLADIGFYLVHRAFHTFPVLWKFHAIHHSIEELDWLAAHRVHPVDQILTKGASLIPCFALGFSEAALAVYAVIYQWHAILLHSNVNLKIGPLRWLIAAPNFHHWHHSDHKEAYNKNYAGQFSFLDVLFGTAHMPAGLPSKYGCSDKVPETYGKQLLYPFGQFLMKKRHRPSRAKDSDVKA